MFGLKKSKVVGVGYTLYNIPKKRKIKIAVHDDGNYITLISRDANSKGWFRLGDRPDLKPIELNGFGLTCCRTEDKGEQEKFVKKVLKVFGY